MNAPFSAMLVRTVKLDTRFVWTHVKRASLGALMLVGIVSLVKNGYSSAAAGLDLLAGISICAAALISIYGISLFSRAITEEKEEQNVSLLRMAGLQPCAFLLAKMGARLWDTLLLLASVLPFALLAVTMGGVTDQRVCACLIALAAYVVFLANLGLLLSVILRTSQGAAQWTLLILILLNVLAPLLLVWCWHLLSFANATIWLRLFDITTNRQEPSLISLHECVYLLAGAACFLASWALFDRCVHDTEGQELPRTKIRRDSAVSFLCIPRPRPGLAALMAKDQHFICGGRVMMIIKPLVVLAFLAFLAWLIHHDRGRWIWQDAEMQGSFTEISFVICLSWLLLEAAFHLSRLFASEVVNQTLGALIVLPFTPAQIVVAKVRVAAYSLLPVTALLAVIVCVNPVIAWHAAQYALYSITGWACLANALLVVSLTTYLSLTVRQGGLVLAVCLTLLCTLSIYVVIGSACTVERATNILMIIYVPASIVLWCRMPHCLAVKASH